MPGTGRFMTEDPIRDGLNWYTYCGNNPVMFVDPSGLVDVMLPYIIGKNDGSIIGYGIDFSLIFTSPMSAINFTVKIGETAHTYTLNEVRAINGYFVMDNKILMNDFGLTQEIGRAHV